MWRHLMLTYYAPRVGGEVMTPLVTHSPNFTLMFDDIAAKTGRNPLEAWPSLKTGNPVSQQNPSLKLCQREKPAGVAATTSRRRAGRVLDGRRMVHWRMAVRSGKLGSSFGELTYRFPPSLGELQFMPTGKLLHSIFIRKLGGRHEN